MRLIACLFFLLISFANAHAAFFTAEHLLQTCKSYTEGREYNNADEPLCNAYIMGVHDTAKSYETLYGGVALYCEPPRVTSDQMVLAAKKYLLTHPEFMLSPAAPKVVDAFTAAFPCD